MKSVTVDFYNERTTDVFGKHETVGGAYTQLSDVLDKWKELIEGENASGVFIQMVYTDHSKRVAIEEVELFQLQKEPRDDADKVTMVQSDSFALEVATLEECVELYNTLCDHVTIDIDDNRDEVAHDDQWMQSIVLNPTSERDSVTIDVIRKK